MQDKSLNFNETVYIKFIVSSCVVVFGIGAKKNVHIHCSQLAVAPAPRDQIPIWSFCGYQEYLWCIDIHTDKTLLLCTVEYP